MRAALCLLLVSSPAFAESFVGATAGAMFPIGDSHDNSNDGWEDLVSSSPKFGVRAGATSPTGVGGMLTIDFTPISSNSENQFTDVSAQRWRIMAQVVFDKPLAAKLRLTGRAGAGLDIAHASYDANVFGVQVSGSDTDLGFGFEFGAGIWFDVGGADLGAELAFPFGFHSHRANSNDEITLDYTSYDLDLLFGVRVRR